MTAPLLRRVDLGKAAPLCIQFTIYFRNARIVYSRAPSSLPGCNFLDRGIQLSKGVSSLPE